jgi:hypothetical protein
MTDASKMTYRELSVKALHALRNKDAQAIEDLLRGGMDPNMKLSGSTGTKRGITISVAFDDPTIFDLYVRYGAVMNLPVVGINNPLFLSVSKEDERGTIRALAAGADVAGTRNRGSKKDQKVLHVAVESGNPDMVRMLLDAGGWVDIPNKQAYRHTPRRQEVQALLKRYRELPRLDFEAKDFDRAALFATDAEGNCPLDHPETWARWHDVCAVLDAKGETLSKADLQQRSAEGHSWLEQAVRCFALPKVLETLNQQNEAITQDDLLDSAGKASDLFESVRRHRQLPVLFTFDNCRKWSPVGLTQVNMQLDEPERASLPNMHLLRAQLRQHSAQQGNPGRGR